MQKSNVAAVYSYLSAFVTLGSQRCSGNVFSKRRAVATELRSRKSLEIETATKLRRPCEGLPSQIQTSGGQPPSCRSSPSIRACWPPLRDQLCSAEYPSEIGRASCRERV